MPRPKPVIGNAANHNGRLTTVRTFRPIEVFITRLSPDTENFQIAEFLKKDHNIDTVVERLTTRYDSYSSFKIKTTTEHIKTVMNPETWPEGVLIRKFFNPKPKFDNTTTNLLL